MKIASYMYHPASLRTSALFLLIHRLGNCLLVVETSVGNVAVLPCEIYPTIPEPDVEWSRPDLPREQYVHYQRNGKAIDDGKNPSYEGRTSLFMDEVMKGNVSLKLSRVTPSDAGNYTCYLPEFKKKVTVQLIVGEHVPQATQQPSDGDSTKGPTLTCLGAWCTDPWTVVLVFLPLGAIVLASMAYGLWVYTSKRTEDKIYKRAVNLPV